MKKLIIIAVLVLTALCAKAQFFNGVEIGVSVHYSNHAGKSNVGIDIMATKRVAEWSRLRAGGSINGFIPQSGYDRYGKLTVGATVDFLPFYLYAGYGLAVNPSAKKETLGMAFDCGIGLEVAVAKRWNIITELEIDRVRCGKVWISTPSVKLGTSFAL